MTKCGANDGVGGGGEIWWKDATKKEKENADFVWNHVSKSFISQDNISYCYQILH
jgi:hypothetical protein